MYKPSLIPQSQAEQTRLLKRRLEELEYEAAAIKHTKRRHMELRDYYIEIRVQSYKALNQQYPIDTDENVIYWNSMMALCDERIEGLRVIYERTRALIGA